MSAEQLGVIAAAAILVFWMVGAYNRLVAHRSAIGSALAQVAELLQRRSATLLALAEALRDTLRAEQGTLDALLAADAQQSAAIEALRQRPVMGPLAAAVTAAEVSLAASLARTLALLDQHPDARDDPTRAAPHVAVLREIEPRLAFARQLHNDAVASYNAAARQFPTRLLTRLFGFGTAGRL